jgi:gliding motility-associated peptidyl-prolyl isomerase
MYKLILVCIIIGLTTSCKSPEPRKPISVKSGSFFDQSIARNKKLYEAEKAQIQEIITKSSEDKYIASENGFWYAFQNKIESDSLKTPTFGDIVNFNHSISYLNGTVIYSREELKTRNYAMDKEELFTGLREGLKLMKAGETATFIFPSQKAYGYYGDENKIGTNTPIISKVTVNSVTQK